MRYTVLLSMCLACSLVTMGTAEPRPKMLDEDPIPPPDRAAEAIVTDAYGNPLPEYVDLGEPLFFSAKQSVAGKSAKSYAWHVSPSTRWERARILDDGKTLVVGTGTVPVEITVTLMVAVNDTVDYVTISVKCGQSPQPPPGPVPTPTPIPNPDPKPQPVTDTKLAIKKLADEKLPNAATPALRVKMAGAYRVGAQRITDGKVPDTTTLLKITADNAVAQLGINDMTLFVPWRNAVTDYIKGLNLSSVQQHASIWLTIADVLEGK